MPLWLRPAFSYAWNGFAAYVSAAWCVFRVAERLGRRGRPRFVWPQGFLLAQVVKSHHGRRLSVTVRRVVVGTEQAVLQALACTGGATINTAYIERFNALWPSTTIRAKIVGGNDLLHRWRRLDS